MEQDRNQTIDFIKGFLIIGIILCHAVQVIPGINRYVFQILRLGQLGCQIFFFLSGYLMFIKFESEKMSFFSFLKKKIGGVIVPWYLAIVFYFLMTNYLVDMKTFPYLTNTKLFSVIINIFFLNGLVPFANNNVVLGGWYLGTLVMIWLLFPMLFKLRLKYENKLIYVGIPLCLLAVVVLSLTLNLSIGRNSFLYFSFLTQLPCVILGMFYIEISKVFYNYGRIRRLFIILITAVLHVALFYKPIYFSSILTPILTSLLTIFLLPIIKIKESIITKIFLYFGKKSLYIYLFHVFIVWHFQYYAYRQVLSFVEINHTLLFFALLLIEFLLIILVCEIVEYLVDAMISLKDKITIKFINNKNLIKDEETI